MAALSTGHGVAGQAGADRIEDIYGLSPLQQGMLFHILSAPGSRLYLDQTLCTLDGALDVDAFQRAWQTVIDRHPGLRTAFMWEGLSKPVQVVYREVPLPIEQADWRHLSPKAQASQLQSFLAEDRRQAYDLTRPPLTRLYLIRMSDDSYQLVWSVSHLVVDAWCSSIVLDEVVRLYEAYRQGSLPVLPAVHPYRDYIAWLRRQELARAESFWTDYLQGFNVPTGLSHEDPSGTWPGTTLGYRQEDTTLPELDVVALRSRARDLQVTLNTLVQAAWSLVLAHRTDESDVVFGTAVSGRPPSLPGVESIVGLFINTLPHRVTLQRETALGPWLQQVQARQVEIRQYEHTPLAKIQGWSNIPAGLPLFESLVVFLNIVDLERQDTGSLDLRNLRYVGRPHYPLTLQVTPGRRELRLEAVYDVARFRQMTVLEVLGQLKAVLGVLAMRPHATTTVNDVLSLLARSDRDRQLQETRRRRDSNTGKLRLTKAIKVKLPPAHT